MPSMQTPDRIIATSTHPVYVIDWNRSSEHGSRESLPRPVKEWLEAKHPELSLEDIEADPENADSRRMTIRIPSFAHQAVCARAARCGMKPSKWVAALVQSNVTRMPVFAENELRVLEVTNRELFAIGRNINQMSRVLNEAHFKTEQLRIEKLAELAAYIRKTRDAIRGLIRASRGVWRGEE